MPKEKDTSETYENMVDIKSANTSNGLLDFMDETDRDNVDNVSQQEYYEKLWSGMPKYVPNNNEPIKQLMISFENWEDYRAFGKLIGFPLTEKTKSVFYPIKTDTILDQFRWIDDSEVSDEE